MNALIIEPSPIVAGIIKTICLRYGFKPILAKDGGGGLRALARNDFDLILLSYELGDMNGIEFFTQAKAHKHARDVPSVMFAGTTNASTLNEALHAGITECFSKKETSRLEEFIGHCAEAKTRRFCGKVMLVEDSRTAALYVKRMLEEMGLEVELFSSAEQAIEAFAQSPYDLVLTDYILAGNQSGLAVIRAIRGSDGRKSLTPILAMSGLVDTARKIEILRNGANDFVFKPLVPEELKARVHNLLSTQQLMRRLEDQSSAMKDMAMKDQLTGLYNRHYLQETLPLRFDDLDKTEEDIALNLVDIDHFKQINDTYGHAVGDKVLVEVAQALSDRVGDGQILARIGGEEFIFLTPVLSAESTRLHSEELRKALETLCPAGIAITASFGLALREPGESYESLFRRADKAVYRAKAAGRNRVELA